MEPQHAGLAADTNFWVLLSTLLFLAIAIAKGKGAVLAMLDARTDRIRHQLDEAERLHEQARELLSDYQKKHNDALKTSTEIIEHARQSAAQIEVEAKAKLEEQLKRREEQVVSRIKMAEDAAIADIRNRAADLAVIATRHLLADQLKAGADADLVDQSIGKIKSQLN